MHTELSKNQEVKILSAPPLAFDLGRARWKRRIGYLHGSPSLQAARGTAIVRAGQLSFTGLGIASWAMPGRRWIARASRRSSMTSEMRAL
jgi:hypothetical protein